MAAPTLKLGFTPGIRIHARQDQFEMAKALLDPAMYAAVMQAAISDTQRTLVKDAANEVQKELVIKDRDAKKAFNVKKPSFSDLTGIVAVKRIPLPLEYFSPTRKRQGVSVRIRRSKGRQTLRSTFLWHHKVFERQFADGKGGKRVGRLPLKRRYGPTLVGVMAGAPGMLDKLTEQARDTLQKNIDSQMVRAIQNPKSFARVRKAAAAAVAGAVT